MADFTLARLGEGSRDSIRDTIIKTAKYVADSGTDLEGELRDDPRFSFINPTNPNYGIYKQALSEEAAARSGGSAQDNKGVSKPQEPYPFSFVTYSKNLTQRDLEIIKLSAAYCVANEDSEYLEKMRNQFGEDDLFGFLRPEHALNGTFVQFMNQYKQVKSGELGPPFFELKNEDFKHKILHRSFERAQFNEYSKELRSEKEKAKHLEKVQFSAFPWTEFKVVTKYIIPTSDDVELPEPLDFRQLAVERLGSESAPDIFDRAEEQKRASGKDIEGKSRKRKVKAAGQTRMKKRNVEETSKESIKTKYIECPISHKNIPEDKFDKHLQVLLVDPHYKAEREKYEAKHKLSNLSSAEVYENVKRLAKGAGKYS